MKRKNIMKKYLNKCYQKNQLNHNIQYPITHHRFDNQVKSVPQTQIYNGMLGLTQKRTRESWNEWFFKNNVTKWQLRKCAEHRFNMENNSFRRKPDSKISNTRPPPKKKIKAITINKKRKVVSHIWTATSMRFWT